MKCSACSASIPDTSRFCASCGAPVDGGATPTIVGDAPTTPPAPKTPSRPPSAPSTPRNSGSLSSNDGRFVPGTLLAERYRIVALAGRGGMGEVYRAEDLTLDQEVAIKFLPAELAQDGAALARFHREVRIARQVSHPNVCRVFDIGASDGIPFLTMEYVDGEDLSTLLRRIGRFPADKGIEIARQICAGVAAAHDHGVLHRDLKTSNVMLDGRGKVRLTDFGLAGLAGQFGADEKRAGTPQYMAPEQLAGGEATVQSDIYSLGLVLYEVFTGKRAYDAATVPELMRLRESSSPTNPTNLVKDLDPVVERVILRCLERDPAKRPSSALQVAAALPGGDPLAAALAAGETPSPEMVAASGSVEGLRPLYAWLCVGLVALTLFFELAATAYTRLYRNVSMPKPPDVLQERAQELLHEFGYTDVPADTAAGFEADVAYLDYVNRHDNTAARWHDADRSINFWYRTSSDVFVPVNLLGPLTEGLVTSADPPPYERGMTTIRLDALGRLQFLRAIPQQAHEARAAVPPPMDWNRLLTEAGFDPGQCKTTEPRSLPTSYADARAAWTTQMPERPGSELRIEAAAYRGRPVYFNEFGPWNPELGTTTSSADSNQRAAASFAIVIVGVLLIAGVVLTRRNLKRGRGDTRGAWRLAAFIFCATLLVWVVGSSHIASLFEAYSLTLDLAWASLSALFLWMLYIALEPFVRHRMPRLMISWSRLLSGKFRDPMVGRDILAGIIAALLSDAISNLNIPYTHWRSLPPPQPDTSAIFNLVGGRLLFARVLDAIPFAVFNGLALMFTYVLMRRLLRNRWLAMAGFIFVFSVQLIMRSTPVFDIATNVLGLAVLVFVIQEFGLLALIVTFFVSNLVSELPLTPQFSAWYAWMGWFAVALIVALTAYAMHTSLAGHPLFGAAAFDD